MAITNLFSITYGTLTVGGASDSLLLSGPYVVDRSHPRLRLVFDVMIVATSHATLQSLSEQVEAGLSARDKSLTIDIAGDAWEYTFGDTILNTTATCAKSGNRDTDRGYGRAYTVTIEGDLPAADQDGLRELEVHTDFAPSRQKTVSMRGVYTALDGDTATTVYGASFDARAAAILTSIDDEATWELVHEESGRDRNDSTLQFQRQYLQILAEQSIGVIDDPAIRDHRVSFTDLSQHPGDSAEGVHRLRRVAATYDCAVDVEVGQDMQQVFDQKILPHLISLFVANLSPRVYGIEEMRVSLDRSQSRASVAVQFIYQKNGGDDVVEVTESVTTRETRTIDYTPVHDGQELAFYVDSGWLNKERIYSRTAMVIGDQPPIERLTKESASSTDARGSALPAIGGGADIGGGGVDSAVNSSGWNTISSTSQSTRQYIGDPDYGQIAVTIVSETVTKRYSVRPF